jgi:hypothetical protein
MKMRRGKESGSPRRATILLTQVKFSDNTKEQIHTFHLSLQEEVAETEKLG